MTEQSKNNLPLGSEQAAENIDDEFIPEDAWPLCPNCLKPCNPLQNYCDNCSSNEVINPMASYMPFVRIRFTCGFFGKMWRKGWYDKDSSIIIRLLCLFLVTLFAPILFIVGLPLFLTGKIPKPELRRITTAAIYITAILLLMFFMYFNLFSPVSIR